MRKLIILVTTLLVTGSSWANIVINGTRIIFPEAKKEAIVQLVNSGGDPALVQSWIDDGDINSTPESANVPFLLSPPVVKVDGHNGQQLRIKKLQGNYPPDRESVFFLNVLDIPAMPEHLKGLNTIQLAIKSRIKIFYRPAGLKGTLENAVDKLIITSEGKDIQFVNTSGFYITIANIERNTQKLLIESTMIAPRSDIKVHGKVGLIKGLAYQVMFIDDLGAYKYKSLIAK